MLQKRSGYWWDEVHNHCTNCLHNSGSQYCKHAAYKKTLRCRKIRHRATSCCSSIPLLPISRWTCRKPLHSRQHMPHHYIAQQPSSSCMQNYRHAQHRQRRKQSVQFAVMCSTAWRAMHSTAPCAGWQLSGATSHTPSTLATCVENVPNSCSRTCGAQFHMVVCSPYSDRRAQVVGCSRKGAPPFVGPHIQHGPPTCPRLTHTHTHTGKTSVINALAGRLPKGGTLEGTILVNGQPRTKAFRNLSAYVLQNDILLSCLTVRETFTVAARLRLPSSVDRAEREKLVEQVITELGLSDVADTFVGMWLCCGWLCVGGGGGL